MNDVVLTKEQYDPSQSRFQLEFSTNEATGMIRSFDVSEEGRIATYINPSSINIYDEYGNYDFSIYTNISKAHPILQWENDALSIYLDFSGDSGSYYELIEIDSYEHYKVYTCPVDDNTERFWDELEYHERELITNEGKYYVENGNLRFSDNGNGSDYALTENTSFQPWWLLIIPILTAIIWFGFLRKRVKQWEKERTGQMQDRTDLQNNNSICD